MGEKITRKFRLHWKGGKTEDISTNDTTSEESQEAALVKAFRASGLGAGAVAALDYWEEI